jgi:hypothetical protein
MTQNKDWTTLFKAGCIASLLAAVLFRRNIGAEVSLFTGVEAIPHTAAEWYTLLQNNPFVGLAFLAFFDLINYILVGLIFLALGVAYWQASKSLSAIALAGGFVGVAVSFASNISLTMLSLSQQHATAISDAQKTSLLAARQTILTTNDPLAIFPGTGIYISLLLIALAGGLFSILMLSSNRSTGIVGLLACGCDLAYCLTFAFAPSLRALWLASGGLFWMIWHLLVARILLNRSKE